MSAAENPSSDIDSGRCRPSPVGSTTDCLSEDVDLEGGELELKVHSAKEDTECRICLMNFVGGGGNEELGIAIELGCCCKGDLGAAHKKCAESWFKIRGNRTCEICGATALNVVGEQTTKAFGAGAASTSQVTMAETRCSRHGRFVMKFLLSCMASAFLLYLLFRVISVVA